ncbi:MAG: hypothetical protein Q9218_001352, partial [Villophora microphyllina]
DGTVLAGKGGQVKMTDGRDAAKEALLAAFRGIADGLGVPTHIVKIEKDLEAKYRAKNAVANEKLRKREEEQRQKEEIAERKRESEEEKLLAEVLNVEPTAAGQRMKTKAAVERFDVRSVRGDYIIVAPKVSDGWKRATEWGPLRLALAPSSTLQHLWGSFDFGVFEGMLRSSTPISPTSNMVKFLWRGRDTGTGESTYRPENITKFTFLPDGKFKGTMYWDCLGKFELAGKLDLNASHGLYSDDSVSGWKSQYHSLNDLNYERERVGRWGGGWGYGGHSEPESNSDTDGGRSDSEGGSEDHRDKRRKR